MAVSAKTKNPKVRAATTKNLKSTSGGKILSLTDMHGHGSVIKLMFIQILSFNFCVIRKEGENVSMKICSDCRILKKKTDFYFRNKKQKLRKECAQCTKVKTKSIQF